jgi:hypothetical protein
MIIIRLLIFILVASAMLIFISCGSQPKVDINSSPITVVETLFEVANNQKFELLQYLCDPQQENDGDTDCLCALSDDYIPHKCPLNSHNRVSKKEFSRYFKNGKISGDVKFEGDVAFVPFYFGPDGNDEETFRLIKREGKWYLKGF